jgi:hypothetical protein
MEYSLISCAGSFLEAEPESSPTPAASAVGATRSLRADFIDRLARYGLVFFGSDF